MSKKSLLKKWQPLVESEGMPAIASMKRKDIVARIFENQDEDIAHNEGGVYTDQVVVNSMIDVKGRINEAKEKALAEATSAVITATMLLRLHLVKLLVLSPTLVLLLWVWCVALFRN
ncbi:major head protein [Aeromonas phage Ah1]|uniref:Major head protein n=1 Tax=Aeromonas phage Ah1 TaxID=2053701 RepID=A0A2H4YF20_9CAUD|nr:major head protein [Aeromonas phage Ah1]AUE22761.1 major head protein [Aeromonas phage Ah1]